MSRFRNMVEDTRKYLGLFPYDKTYKTDEFRADCEKLHGKDAFNEMLATMKEMVLEGKESE
jgi:hypothetical protein